MSKITLVVPEGVEVEIRHDRWMPPGMRVLVEQDGWSVVNRGLFKFFDNDDLYKLYEGVVSKMGLAYSQDEHWWKKGE